MKVVLAKGWRGSELKRSWKTLVGIVVLACSLVLLIALLWIRYYKTVDYSDEKSVVSLRRARLDNAEHNLHFYFLAFRSMASLYNLQLLDTTDLWDPRVDPEWVNAVRQTSWSMLSTVSGISRIGVLWDKGTASYQRVNYVPNSPNTANSGTVFLELGVLNETSQKMHVSYWQVPLSYSWQHCPDTACEGFVPRELDRLADMVPEVGSAQMYMGTAGCSYAGYVIASDAARINQNGTIERVPSPPVRTKPLTTCLLPAAQGVYILSNFFSEPWVQAILAQDSKLSFTLNVDNAKNRIVQIYSTSALTLTRPGMVPFRVIAGISFSTESLTELLSGLQLGNEGIFVMTVKGAILVATSFSLNITSLVPAARASHPLVAAAGAHIVGKFGASGSIVVDPTTATTFMDNQLLEEIRVNDTSYFLDFMLVNYGLEVVVVVITPVFSLQIHDTHQFTVLVALTAAMFTAAVVLLCALRSSLARERRRKGQLLVAKERAEATSTMTTKFVAHEMSAPLLALRNLTDLLLEECLSHKPLLASKYTSMARASMAPLQQLQSDMQDFDRILSGHMRLEVGVVDLEDVFESTLSVIQMNKSPYVELVLDISENCPRFVLGDAGRIKQVLSTVLSNSMHCTQRGNVMVRLTCARNPKGPRGSGPPLSKGDPTVGWVQPSQPSHTLHGPAQSMFFPRQLQMHHLGPDALEEGGAAEDEDDGVMDALSSHAHGASAYLSCLVCDTGPEILEPESIFDMSARGDGGKRAREEGGGGAPAHPFAQLHRGGGMNFVVARSIARMMGGDLKVPPNHRGGTGAKIQFDMLLLVAEEQQYSWQSASALASGALWDLPSAGGGGNKSSHCGMLAEEAASGEGEEEGASRQPLVSTGSQVTPPSTPAALGSPFTPPASNGNHAAPQGNNGDSNNNDNNNNNNNNNGGGGWRKRREDKGGMLTQVPTSRAVNGGGNGNGGGTGRGGGGGEVSCILLCLSGALESHTVERWFARKGYRVLKARNLQHACALLGHPLEQPPQRPQLSDSVYYSPAAASWASAADMRPPAGPPAEDQPLMTIIDSDFLLSSVLFAANLVTQMSVSSRDASGLGAAGVLKPGRRRAISCGNALRASGSFNSSVDNSTQSDLGDGMIALLERLPLCCCVAWVLSGNAPSARAVENEIKEGHRLASMVAGMPPTDYMMMEQGYRAAAWTRFRMAVVRAPIHTWRLKSLLASARAWDSSDGTGGCPRSADGASALDDRAHGWSERVFRFAAEWQGSSPSAGSEPKSLEEVAFGMGKPPLTPAPDPQAWLAAGAKQLRDAGRHQLVPMTPPDAFPHMPPNFLDSPVKLAGMGQATQINYSELQLLEKIGEGTFGEVFRGKWFGKEVAIKRMRTSTLTGSMLEEFHKEVGILESIRHPNCVLYMGFCLQPQLCIVTEFIAGGNLAQRLRMWRQQHNGRPLEMALLLKVARDVCLGMMFLHFRKQHMMHRDLKSNNLLVDAHWNTKVADFGISRFLGDGTLLPMTQAIGSPGWMAPELFRGKKYDEKIDVYSYGIILWELLALELPYAGMGLDPLALIYQVVCAQMRPTIPPDAPPQLVELMTQCWADDPCARPSFDIVLRRLDAMGARRSLDERDGRQPQQQLSPWSKEELCGQGDGGRGACVCEDARRGRAGVPRGEAGTACVPSREKAVLDASFLPKAVEARRSPSREAAKAREATAVMEATLSPLAPLE